MQASCPHCSYKIVIDDSRVPDRPFNVKCPKCQNAVKFQGKSPAAAAPAPAPPPPAPPAAEAEAPAAGFNPEEMRSMMAQLRTEMRIGGGEAAGAHQGERALVALPAPHAGNAALMLARLGYATDTADDGEEAARLLEQGVYAIVVTMPAAGPQGKETLYQRACRLNAEYRRRIFMVLVADNLKSGDGTQAFVLQGDLALASRDVAGADAVFRATLAEKKRLYQAFVDAKRRADQEAGYI
jgi:predicted Zn finger-like uncharacterized protein